MILVGITSKGFRTLYYVLDRDFHLIQEYEEDCRVLPIYTESGLLLLKSMPKTSDPKSAECIKILSISRF